MYRAEIAQAVFNRLRVRPEMDEGKTIDLRRFVSSQTVFFFPKPVDPVHFRRTGKPAVQPVGPGMERAADGVDRALPVKQTGAAMPAGICEGLQRALIVAQHDYRISGDIQRFVIAFFREPVGPADADPAPSEDRLAFGIQNSF